MTTLDKLTRKQDSSSSTQTPDAPSKPTAVAQSVLTSETQRMNLSRSLQTPHSLQRKSIKVEKNIYNVMKQTIDDINHSLTNFKDPLDKSFNNIETLAHAKEGFEQQWELLSSPLFQCSAEKKLELYRFLRDGFLLLKERMPEHSPLDKEGSIDRQIADISKQIAKGLNPFPAAPAPMTLIYPVPVQIKIQLIYFCTIALLVVGLAIFSSPLLWPRN